jgi:hypothetical protein
MRRRSSGWRSTSAREAVRSAPLVQARGRLERRDGVVNVVVAKIRALDGKAAASSPRGRSPAVPDDAAARRRIHQRAVDQLRAVAPRGHMFGRK